MPSSNHKKLILIFGLVAAVVIAALPVLNTWRGGFERNTQKMFNADVADGFLSYVVYRLFGRSLHAEQGIAGKNKFLFLGNANGRVIHKSQGHYPFKDQEVMQWAQDVQQLRDWYAAQGIDFLLVAVPNKHSIYPEHLPNWVETTRPNLTDALLAQAHQAQLPVLDLRPAMHGAKANSEHLLYWKTDSHWNHHGAAMGFATTLDQLENILQKPVVRPTYQISQSLVPGLGSAWLMKINHWLGPHAEKMTHIDIDQAKPICMGDIEPTDLTLAPCENATDGSTFFIHQGPKYSINTQAPNPQKVLLMCDSFVGSVSELFQQSFNTVWTFHYNKLPKDQLQAFVEANKPDLVIYQIVERSLFKQGYLKQGNLKQ